MNNNKNSYLLFILAGLFPGQSMAALIDQDWQTANDSKLLLDTSTGLRWLDASVTMEQSYNYIQTQFQQGGAYEGFRYATLDEVLHLWSEAYISDTNYTWVINGEWGNVKDLADRLGPTILFDPYGLGTHVLAVVEGDLTLPPNERRVLEISYHSNGVDVRTSSNFYAVDVDYANHHVSSYLVQAAPPVLLDGDVNRDGGTDAGDLLIISNIVLGNAVAPNIEPGHADYYPPGSPDGIISLQDLILLRDSIQ